MRIKIINFPVFDESVTHGPSDRPTEGRTDKPGYKDARMYLEISSVDPLTPPLRSAKPRSRKIRLQDAGFLLRRLRVHLASRQTESIVLRRLQRMRRRGIKRRSGPESNRRRFENTRRRFPRRHFRRGRRSRRRLGHRRFAFIQRRRRCRHLMLVLPQRPPMVWSLVTRLPQRITLT